MTGSINSIVFDIDSCIVNFHKIYSPIVNQVLDKKFQIQIEDWQVFRGLDIPDVLRGLDIKVSDLRANKIRNEIIEKSLYTIENEIQFGLEKQELLYKLKDKGYRLAINTSLPSKIAFSILKAIHCTGYFDYIFTSDDISFLPPKPQFYGPVFMALGGTGENIMIFPGSPATYKAANETPASVRVLDSASQLTYKFVTENIDKVNSEFEEAEKTRTMVIKGRKG